METKTGRFEMTVTQENTAKTMGSGSLDVLATPAMVAMMEHAACLALEDALEPGLTWKCRCRMCLLRLWE